MKIVSPLALGEDKKNYFKDRYRFAVLPLLILTTIPSQLQREGLSLSSLQTSLRGRWRGNCHPGELGKALRKLGFKRNGEGMTIVAFALCGIVA